MELQDTYAAVYNNTICVHNTANFTTGDYAFGISYCQETSGDHYYYIYQNNVTVYNGKITVYIADAYDGIIEHNNLTAYLGNVPTTGNSTVFDPSGILGVNP